MSPADITLDFIGVGVSRCATTWISDMLRKHPDIFIPQKKELHYFNNRSGEYNEDLNYLNDIFPSSSDLLLGEFTPRYIISDQALRRIKSHFPDIQLLVSLRNPLERAISQYRYFIFELKKENNFRFSDAIDDFYFDDYIKKSLYYRRLKHLFSLFDRDQIKLIWFRDVKNNPKYVLEELFEFLGVSNVHTDGSTGKTNAANDDLGISFIENTYNKISKNTKYSENFAGASEYRILSLLSRHRVLRKLFQISQPAFQVFGFLEKLFQLKSVHIQLTTQQKKQLYDRFFKNDVEQLEELLDLDLSEWKYE